MVSLHDMLYELLVHTNKRELTSIDLWRYIVYNNLVTWSHQVTLVTVEVNKQNNDSLYDYYVSV